MPNFLEGIQNVGSRAVNTVKNNVRVDWNNPFDDGKGGINVSVGNLGGVGINVERGVTGAQIKGSVTTGSGRGAITSSIGGEVGISGIGVFGESSTEGSGSSKIGVGIGKNPLSYQYRDKDGRLIADIGAFPVDGVIETIKNGRDIINAIGDILEADANKATNKAYEDYNNRQRQQRPSQPQQRPSQPQQRSFQPQQKSSGNSKIQSPNLPTGTPRSIPQFGTPQQTVAPTGRIPSEFTPRREATQQPFTIPTDIPKTNTRLPRKPQIGGKTAQQNSGTNQRNGGITLGNAPRQNSSPSQRNGGISFGGNGAPQQDSRVNQRNSGRTIVSPEELEDISANNPNNKPRIVQPQQNSEPRSAYRLLSTREKQLFDCIQNGGGEACNSKYGEDPKPSSNNSNNEGFSLSLGDPYIGMGIQE